MMELTQSIEQIKTYLKENENLGFSKEIVKDKKQETLMDNLNRYIFKTTDRNGLEVSANCHASIKAAHYAALLFENMIKSSIKIG